MIKQIVVSLVTVALMMYTIGSAAAKNEDVKITTGGKTGTYFKVGHNIRKVLGGQVMNSKGGVENIERLMSGEAQIGFAQSDTYAFMSTGNPEVETTVEIMGSPYKEAVYIVANKAGRVRNENDLQKEGVTIAVGKKGSGGESTWNYMRQLEPGYKKPAVSFTGGIRALGKLAAQPEGSIDAVLFVTKPVIAGKMIATVMNNPDLVFIDVNDMDLNDTYKPTGKPIYDFCKIDVAKGVFNDKEIKTICMETFILANVDTDEDYLDSLSDLILNYQSTLVK